MVLENYSERCRAAKCCTNYSWWVLSTILLYGRKNQTWCLSTAVFRSGQIAQHDATGERKSKKRKLLS
jgi:hypothetical protein